MKRTPCLALMLCLLLAPAAVPFFPAGAQRTARRSMAIWLRPGLKA